MGGGGRQRCAAAGGPCGPQEQGFFRMLRSRSTHPPLGRSRWGSGGGGSILGQNFWFLHRNRGKPPLKGTQPKPLPLINPPSPPTQVNKIKNKNKKTLCIGEAHGGRTRPCRGETGRGWGSGGYCSASLTGGGDVPNGSQNIKICKHEQKNVLLGGKFAKICKKVQKMRKLKKIAKTCRNRHKFQKMEIQ